MFKTDLVDEISKQTGISKTDTTSTLDAFEKVVKDAILKGETIQWIGFGSFSVVQRSERNSINPSTHEKVVIPAKRAMKFKPAKAINVLLNGAAPKKAKPAKK